jgi:tetratricopeptide (TPR) repeat protein
LSTFLAAISAVQFALAAEPTKNVEAFAYLSKGSPTKIASYQNGEDWAFYCDLGDYCIEHKAFVQAEAAYGRALKWASKSASKPLKLGDLNRKTIQVETSNNRLRSLYLAWALDLGYQNARAEEMFKKALAITGSNKQVWQKYAEYLRANHRNSEAEEAEIKGGYPILKSRQH